MNLLNSIWFWSILIFIMGSMYFLREYDTVVQKHANRNKSPWPPPSVSEYIRPIPPISQLNSKGLARPVPILKLQERILIGDNLSDIKKSAQNILMTNRINKEWKKFLSDQLVKYQPKDVKVKIVPQKSFIQVDDDKGRYLEEVYVETIFPTGEQNSFKALVDSQSGRILDSWDWSRATMNRKKEAQALKLPPHLIK